MPKDTCQENRRLGHDAYRVYCAVKAIWLYNGCTTIATNKNRVGLVGTRPWADSSSSFPKRPSTVDPRLARVR